MDMDGGKELKWFFFFFKWKKELLNDVLPSKNCTKLISIIRTMIILFKRRKEKMNEEKMKWIYANEWKGGGTEMRKKKMIKKKICMDVKDDGQGWR